MLSYVLALSAPELDAERVLLLALVHDLPEVLAGDATPFDHLRNVTGEIPEAYFTAEPSYDDARRRQKRDEESAALVTISGYLGDSAGQQIRDAWEEYEAGQTAEARWVRQIDKLETLAQAEAYARTQPGIVIESFQRGAMRDVTDERLRAVLRDLLSIESND